MESKFEAMFLMVITRLRFFGVENRVCEVKETWENKLEAWREYEIVDAFFIAIILSYQLLIHLHHLIFIMFANKGFSFILKILY